MSKYGARKTFIASIIYMIGITFAAVFALCGPKCVSLVYAFCPLWGFGFGVFYASNNAYWTELVPSDAVAQFMGIYYFAAQILGWAPPAAYWVRAEITPTAMAWIVRGEEGTQRDRAASTIAGTLY